MSIPDHDQEPDKGYLRYWMGVVDTRLASLQKVIEDFVNSDKQNWDRFHMWQSDVNKRLHEGNQKFSNLGARVKKLEENNKNGLEKYVSWDWIRDKILVPIIVWGLILLIGYIVVNAIPMP